MRTSTIRSATIGAAVGIGFIAVGSARADDNSSTACVATTVEGAASPAAAAAPTSAAAATTAAPTTAAGAATTAVAPTTAPAVPTTAAAPAADSVVLGPDATVQQFQAVLAQVPGPTTDFAAPLAPLGLTAPAGVPTPQGTAIEDVSIYYYPDAEDPARSHYDATLTFTADVAAADMVTLFQTELTAAGYIQTADSVENQDGRQERSLTYDIPESAYENAEVTIAIVDGDGDFGQLNVRHQLDPAAINIFSSWPTGMPLVDQATSIDDASLRLNNFGGNYEASIRSSWTLPIPAADAHAQLLAALPSTPYTIDPSYEGDENSTHLVGGEFLDLSVYTSEGYPEGTTYFSVDANFDIRL